ncbi:MAG: SMP-30/gluconolactonase/LRE family protein [Elstera sp.]
MPWTSAYPLDTPKTPPRSKVGECPIWDQQTSGLWYVDIRAPALYGPDPAFGGVQFWGLPSPVGAFTLTSRGDAIVALKTGLYRLNFLRRDLSFIGHPEPDRPDNRLNEGCVSPCGRYFVFGSMDDRVTKEATGALYCLDTDGTIRQIDSGYVVANGLAWSPDGKILYHSDSRRCVIFASDWNGENGTLANTRILAEPGEAEGRPDGAAMDMEGYYWSAGVSAGCLNRFAPDGRLERKISLPVSHPTKPAFGGEGKNWLFVTSMTPADGPTSPLDGYVIEAPAPVPGLIPPRFLG